MEEEKICGLCKSYLRYYFKIGETFIPLKNGGCEWAICTNKVHVEDSTSAESCEYWESDESKKAERKKTIKEYMIRLAKQIEEIAIILEKDEKKQ